MPGEPRAVGDGVGEFRHPLGVDVFDAGQLGLGELLPRRFLDRLEQMALSRRDEQQRGTRPPGPAGAPDPVHIRLGVVRDVVVEHMRYPLDVQTPGSDIGGDQDVDASRSRSAAMVRSRWLCGISPLMAAAENPRARSLSATSSVACLVRTKTIIASNGSTSSTRVSASILRGPATWM